MNKIVIIGAGSAMFAKKLICDVLHYDDIKIENISLCDINMEKLEVMEQVAKKICAQLGKNTVIEASENRRNVLADATYVINVINVGGAEMYKKDLEIPDKYGVKQVIGDIIGPGGMFRFLRAYRDMYAICKDVEELCPEAYFFNYTNPMAPLCLAISKATKVKIFGFCHNVQSTALQLSAYLGTTMDHVSYWAAGINHMDWFLKYKVDGKDAYPELFRCSVTEDQIIQLSKVEPDYRSMGVEVIDTVRFNIMKNFGYFVSESPFHMSEYVPYYRKSDEEIDRLHVRRRWWLDHELEADIYFEELKKILKSDKNFEIEKTFEYAPEIIHANLSGKPFRANLNVMNTGLISNLPNDCVVEVPCYSDAEGIHPCYVGDLPEQLAALNMTNINMHRLMARVVLKRKLQCIYDAVKFDPLTSAQCTLEQINAMVDELIEVNKEYLNDLNIK